MTKEMFKKYWIQTAIYAIITSLCLSFPHVFTYETGRNISLLLVSGILIIEQLHDFSPKTAVRIKPLKLLANQYFILILLCSVTIFAIGALNEKLFDVLPAEHNTLNGAATNAGFIPNGDGALYLLGIQSFLQYGILTYNTLYRPIAHTVNAVIFKVSGEDLILFFYITTFLLIAATTYLGNVIARFISTSLGIASAFFIILFFSRFQATFMTELSGGIVGLLGMALLLSGFFRKNTPLLGAGMVVLALSMQMRMGAIFTAPAFIAVAAFRMGNTGWKSITSLTSLFVILFSLGMSLPYLQVKLFREPFPVESNAGYFFYQIQTGSSTWRQVMKDFPDEFSPSLSYQQTARAAFGHFRQKFSETPTDFFRNYLLMTAKTASNPGDFLFHFWQPGNTPFVTLIFILLLITPWLYPGDTSMRILFWFLIAGIVGALISSPILEEVRRRTYASTISINAICISLAIMNGLKVARLLLARLMRSFSFSTFGAIRLLPSPVTDLKSEIPDYTQAKTGVFAAISAVVFIFAGPVLLDQMRAPAVMPREVSTQTLSDSLQFRLMIAPDKSPAVYINTVQNFVVENPAIISKAKFENNNLLCDTLSGEFYLFSAINQLSHPDYPRGMPFIIIPQRLIGDMKMKDVSLMTLEGKIIKPKKNLLFITEKIVQTSMIEK